MVWNFQDVAGKHFSAFNCYKPKNTHTQRRRHILCVTDRNALICLCICMEVVISCAKFHILCFSRISLAPLDVAIDDRGWGGGRVKLWWVIPPDIGLPHHTNCLPLSNVLGGWQAISATNRLQNWEYKNALKLLQTKFGIFPYYRVSVENSYNVPYDYVITLDEGDVGLPDKFFYGPDADEEVVRGYKLLLRDFAINMGKHLNDHPVGDQFLMHSHLYRHRVARGRSVCRWHFPLRAAHSASHWVSQGKRRAPAEQTAPPGRAEEHRAIGKHSARHCDSPITVEN